VRGAALFIYSWGVDTLWDWVDDQMAQDTLTIARTSVNRRFYNWMGNLGSTIVSFQGGHHKYDSDSNYVLDSGVI
jgi:hypothetical protein